MPNEKNVALQNESELYECKIRMIQIENGITMLNQKLTSVEREMATIRNERDKLIQIQGEIKDKIIAHEKQLELNKHQ